MENDTGNTKSHYMEKPASEKRKIKQVVTLEMISSTQSRSCRLCSQCENV